MSTAKVNFVINFRAAGNASALQSSIKGVTAATRELNAVTTQGIRSKSPMDAVAKQFQARQMSAKQASFAIRNMNAILKEHNALMRATGAVTLAASGAASTNLKIIRGQSTAVATLGQRLKYLNTVMAASAKGMVAFGKQIQWAGRQVMIGLALPLALVGTAASKAAADFDREMTRVVKVTNVGIMKLKKMTADGMKEIGQAYDILDTSSYGLGRINIISEAIQRQTVRIAEFGASVGFAAHESGKLAAEFAQMGYQGKALDELSKAALTLSRVSGAELQDSIQLSRLVVQAFGRDISELTETFARLNMVENNTALSLAEMAGSIPIVASVAKNLGIQIEQLAGMLAIMKEKGIGAREGATALRTGLIRLVQSPTRNAIKAFEGINLNLEEMQKKHAGDITGFFVELSQTLYELGGTGQAGQARIEGFTQALSALTGVRASARFLSLVEDMRFLERVDLSNLSAEELEEMGHNADDVVYQLNEMAEGFDENGLAARSMIGVFTESSAALRVYQMELDRVNDSLAGTQERLKAQMSVELAKLGRIFLKVTNNIRQFAVNLIRSFNDLSDSTKNTVLAITAIVVATGPLTMIFGVLANAVGQIIGLLTKMFPKMQLATAASRAEALAHDQTNKSLVTQISLKESLAATNNKLAASSQKVAASQATATTAARTSTARSSGAAAVNPALVNNLKAIVVQLKLIVTELRRITRRLSAVIIGLTKASSGLSTAASKSIVAATAMKSAAVHVTSVSTALSKSASSAAKSAKSASAAAAAAAKAAASASAAATAAAAAMIAPVAAPAAAAVAASTAASIAKPVATAAAAAGVRTGNAAALAALPLINAVSIKQAQEFAQKKAVGRRKLSGTSGYQPLSVGGVVTPKGAADFAEKENRRIAKDRSKRFEDTRKGSLANIIRQTGKPRATITPYTIMPASIRAAHNAGHVSLGQADQLAYQRRMDAKRRLAERNKRWEEKNLTKRQLAARRRADRLTTDVLTEKEMDERAKQSAARRAAGRSGPGAPVTVGGTRIEERITPAHKHVPAQYITKPGDQLTPVKGSGKRVRSYDKKPIRKVSGRVRASTFTLASGARLSRKEVYDLNKIGYASDPVKGPVWPQGHPQAGKRIPPHIFRKAGIPYPQPMFPGQLGQSIHMPETRETVTRPDGPRQPVVHPAKPSRTGPTEAARKARGPVLKPAKTPQTPSGKPRLINPNTGRVISQRDLTNPLVTTYTLDKAGKPRWPSGHPKAGQLIPKRILEKHGIATTAAATTAATAATSATPAPAPTKKPRAPRASTPSATAAPITTPIAQTRQQRRQAERNQAKQAMPRNEAKKQRNESKKQTRHNAQQRRANEKIRKAEKKQALQRQAAIKKEQAALKERLRAQQAARRAGLIAPPIVGGAAAPTARDLPNRSARRAAERAAAAAERARRIQQQSELKERLKNAQAARRSGQIVPPVVGGPRAPTRRALTLPSPAQRRAEARSPGLVDRHFRGDQRRERAERLARQQELKERLRNQQTARRAGVIAPPVVGGPAAPVARALPSPAARRHAARQAAAAAAAPTVLGPGVHSALGTAAAAGLASRLPRGASSPLGAGPAPATPLHYGDRGFRGRRQSFRAARQGASVVGYGRPQGGNFLSGVTRGSTAARGVLPAAMTGGLSLKPLFTSLLGLIPVLKIVNKGLTAMATRLPFVGKAIAGLLGGKSLAGAAMTGIGAAVGALGVVGSAIAIPFILTFGALAITNREDLIAGFRSTFGEAFARLKSTFDIIGDQIKYIAYLIRSTGGEGSSSFGKLAQIIGKIAGAAARTLANAFNVVLTFIQALLKSVEFLLKLFSGDFSGAAKAFGELLKLVFIGILEVVLSVIEALTNWIPGMGRVTEWARGMLQSWKENATAVDDNTKNLISMNNEIRESRKLLDSMKTSNEEFGKELERWQRYDIISDEDLTDLSNILDEFGRISEADELTQEAIIDHMLERTGLMGHLNDQMQQELIAGVMRNRIEEESNELLRVKEQIYEATKIEQRYERELKAAQELAEEKVRLEEAVARIESQISEASLDSRRQHEVAYLQDLLDQTQSRLEVVLSAEVDASRKSAEARLELEGIMSTALMQEAIRRANESIKLNRETELARLRDSLSGMRVRSDAEFRMYERTQAEIARLQNSMGQPPSLDAISREYNKILQEARAMFDALPGQVGGQIEIQGIIKSMFDGEDTATVNVEADLSKFVSAFKSGMNEVTGEIGEALAKVISDQAKNISDYFKEISDASNEYFDNFKRNLKDQVKAIIEAAEEQIKKEIEMIDELADEKIKAIEDEAEKELELDKLRERLFNREKARIDFLSARRTADVRMQEALLRGDLAEAAILRIQQQADAEEYYLDLVRSREEEIREARERARSQQIDGINERRELDTDSAQQRLDEFKEGVEAAQETAEDEIDIAKDLAQVKIDAAREAADIAREREEQRIQNYLKQWNKITPATEEEFRRHVNALENFLEQSGKNLQKEINSINDALRADLTSISDEFLQNNQEIASQIIGLADTTGMEMGQLGQDMIDIFQNTFSSSLSSIQIFVNGFSSGMASAKSLYEQFLYTFEYDMMSGFDRARTLAIDALTEQAKWESAGASIARALGRGFDGAGGGPGTGGGQGTPAPTPTPAPGPTAWSFPIQEGARGDHVKQLQNALRAAGYDPGSADGIFGARTKSAVMAFQNAAWNAQEWWKVNNRDGRVTRQEWVALSAGNVSASGGSSVPQVGMSGTAGFFHSGGLVGGAGDEVSAILQTGEYVINRKSVAALGTGFLDKINSANARFSAPRVRSLSMSNPNDSNSSSSVTYNLSFQIDGANIDENKLAQEVMFRIKKAERSMGTDRRTYR